MALTTLQAAGLKLRIEEGRGLRDSGLPKQCPMKKAIFLGGKYIYKHGDESHIHFLISTFQCQILQ